MLFVTTGTFGTGVTNTDTDDVFEQVVTELVTVTVKLLFAGVAVTFVGFTKAVGVGIAPGFQT